MWKMESVHRNPLSAPITHVGFQQEVAPLSGTILTYLPTHVDKNVGITGAQSQPIQPDHLAISIDVQVTNKPSYDHRLVQPVLGKLRQRKWECQGSGYKWLCEFKKKLTDTDPPSITISSKSTSPQWILFLVWGPL